MYYLDKIDGSVGVYTKTFYKQHDKIGVWLSHDKQTPRDRILNPAWFETYPLGRYCNHSLTPNTYVTTKGGIVTIYAAKDLSQFDEILVDYTWAHRITGYKSELI